MTGGYTVPVNGGSMPKPTLEPPAPRLVVIIPEDLADSIDLAKRIYGMAQAGRYEVVYLALLSHPENLLALERSLAALRAITSADGIPVSSHIAPSTAWEKPLRELVRPGDALVCTAEQRVARGLTNSEPIQAVLERSFQSTVIVISGYYRPAVFRAKRLLLNLVLWAGFAAIVAGFTLLEIQLDQAVHGAARTVILLMLVSIEIGAVYAWNNYSQR